MWGGKVLLSPLCPKVDTLSVKPDIMAGRTDCDCGPLRFCCRGTLEVLTDIGGERRMTDDRADKLREREKLVA